MNLEQFPPTQQIVLADGEIEVQREEASLLELSYGPGGDELSGLLPSMHRSTRCQALRETSKEHGPRATEALEPQSRRPERRP